MAGKAAGGQRQSARETAVGWCRAVAFAWCRPTARAEKAAEQCMQVASGSAQGKTLVEQQPPAVLSDLTVLFGGRGSWVAPEPPQV